MSDAIRCGQCRWWIDGGDEYGVCELSPPVYIGGNPRDSNGWYQPVTFCNEGCSRGEPKTEDKP